ncbi:hypothetical protein C1H71_14310 [Iodobacter fluviatilis]|uniref:Uncharacterized protein n=1 Tax=Iodobacter fluviatilis TaxID=537 RepID=A0A7G3GAN3_9NEIS|nr:hypothetical protein C1H71_14310 [Iodobacter fluviatilis]
MQQQRLGLDEKRLKTGRGTTLNVVRSRGQLAQLQAALPPLEAQRRIAMYRLAELTGHVPEAIEKVLPTTYQQSDCGIYGASSLSDLSDRSEGKTGLRQISRVFEANSWLFNEKMREI